MSIVQGGGGGAKAKADKSRELVEHVTVQWHAGVQAEVQIRYSVVERARVTKASPHMITPAYRP